uniref:Uncharacterized protein n=1 Tax=viral metagenome TaxID=1070528 RepID=A0A6M3IHI6_9ZZZZ
MMICPMTNITHECDEDECAWFDKLRDQCAVLTIAKIGHINPEYCVGEKDDTLQTRTT